MRGIIEQTEIHPDMVLVMAATHGYTKSVRPFTFAGRFTIDAEFDNIDLKHIFGERIEAGLTTWQDGDKTIIELNLPGVSLRTEPYGQSISINFDQYFWADEAYKDQYLGRTIMVLRFWFDMVIMRIWELFKVQDEDVEWSCGKFDELVKMHI